jgi:hypothetical protein
VHFVLHWCAKPGIQSTPAITAGDLRGSSSFVNCLRCGSVPRFSVSRSNACCPLQEISRFSVHSVPRFSVSLLSSRFFSPFNPLRSTRSVQPAPSNPFHTKIPSSRLHRRPQLPRRLQSRRQFSDDELAEILTYEELARLRIQVDMATRVVSTVSRPLPTCDEIRVVVQETVRGGQEFLA